MINRPVEQYNMITAAAEAAMDVAAPTTKPNTMQYDNTTNQNKKKDNVEYQVSCFLLYECVCVYICSINNKVIMDRHESQLRFNTHKLVISAKMNKKKRRSGAHSTPHVNRV